MTVLKITGRALVFRLAAVIVIAGVNALNSAGVLSSAPGGLQPSSTAQTSTRQMRNT
jgi:hypothetical protein